ncbi:Ankyrin [Labilithrix luteola]|uniref:Ankyrin n=1 Tax=Labilithrix luteola TaxID=1391654 RepID=A0A0K1QFT2_9BACT|nr:ankyrin repeat domain-containing protein [Labilithrix luteola]AKV04583.1 Ankyrin [Labilithrix luteola]
MSRARPKTASGQRERIAGLDALRKSLSAKDDLELTRLIEEGALSRVRAPNALLEYAIRHGSPAQVRAIVEVLKPALSAKTFHALFSEAAFWNYEKPGSALAVDWLETARTALAFTENVDHVENWRAEIDGKPVSEIHSPLLHAIEMNDPEWVALLLGKGVNLARPLEDPHRHHGGSALHFVCSRKAASKAIVEQLIRHGIPVDQPDKRGLTPLALAATSGHLDLVRLLIANGADVDRPVGQERDSSVLIQSVRAGAFDVAQFLVDAGADVRRRDRFGWTAASLACSRRQKPLVESMLLRGAELRPALGLRGEPTTLGLRVTWLLETAAGSAFAAGIKIGDILVTIDSTHVHTIEDAQRCVAMHRALDEVQLELVREGERLRKDVLLMAL